MKRNGAQAGEGKLESRFAALTSGLLARKGHAAPSNSPIHDPAEETDAFALEPTHKNDRKKAPAGDPPKTPAPKPAPAKASAAEPRIPPKESAPAAKRPPAPEAPSAKNAEPPARPAPAAEIKLKASERVAPSPMTVINERSYEAGYPDNPSPEEIAALEAEADEVVSYFENFGTEDAVALEKGDFYGDDDVDVLDELKDLEAGDEEPSAGSAHASGVAVAGPWAGASVPPVAAVAAVEVRAGVTVQLTAREFMRLSLGAAELEQSAQDLIVEAIEEYLDARGVLSLGGCSCLEALTKKPLDR